jgi:hypothetical protein
LKVRRKLEMPMKKKIICFEMTEEGYKFEKLFFSCFQVENKVTCMYKISCLHPKGVSKEHVEPCIPCTLIGFLKVTTLANKWSPKPITIDMFGSSLI